MLDYWRELLWLARRPASHVCVPVNLKLTTKAEGMGLKRSHCVVDWSAALTTRTLACRGL